MTRSAKIRANSNSDELHLIVLAIEFGNEADERESHDGYQCELPGHSKHEDKEANALDDTPQEDVDILGDDVTHLGGVSCQT